MPIIPSPGGRRAGATLFLGVLLYLAVILGLAWCSHSLARPEALMTTNQEAAQGGRGDLFDGARGWINSKPLTLAQLRGKVVLLDFWTYCCINCHHVLPDLARLEQKYKNELVVIGVHTAKFEAERDTENIRRKVREYGIEHHGVNDANQTIGGGFGESGWPTTHMD